MNYLLLALGLILGIGGALFLGFAFFKWNKDNLKDKFDKKDWQIYIVTLVAVGLGFAALIGSIFLFNPDWKNITAFTSGALEGRAVSYAANFIKAMVGMFFFAVSFAALWTSFSTYYYKRKLDEKQKKIFNIIKLSAIAPSVLFFCLWTDAFGAYISYPLISGIKIDSEGFGFFTAFSRPGDGFKIAFYAIVILSGAFISYAVGNHLMYKKYKKKDVYGSTLLVGFASGVIGARIWYVVGNFEREFAGQSFMKYIAIWEGGITILGGAFAGVVFGALWFKLTQKEIDIRDGIDFGVPTVLLAQALGRWGNFFNVEVYGGATEVTGLWNLLPSWLIQQMNLNSGGGSLPAGQMHLPLFLIEAVLNLGGYFIIVYAVGKGLKKWLAKGDLCGAYFLWYGVVRIILEPLRDGKFNMGTDNSWSVCNSLVYIVIGVAIVLCSHLYQALVDEKDKGLTPLWSAAVLLPTLFFPFLQSVTVTSGNDGTGTLLAKYNGFEAMGKTPVFLVSYIMIIIAMVMFAASFFLMKKEKKQPAELLNYGAMALAGLGAVITLFSKGSIPAGSSEYVNFSYGFVLLAIFALSALALSLMPIFNAMRLKKANKKVEAKKENA